MLFLSLTDNLFGWHHYAHIDNLVTVAGHHHTDDILADIVHIALHRCQQHLTCTLAAFCLLSLNSRLQDTNGLFHRTSCLHNLRQEHLSFAKEYAYLVHTCHQRSFDDVDSMLKLSQRLLQVFFEKGAVTLHEGLFQSLIDGCSRSVNLWLLRLTRFTVFLPLIFLCQNLFCQRSHTL